MLANNCLAITLRSSVFVGKMEVVMSRSNVAVALVLGCCKT